MTLPVLNTDIRHEIELPLSKTNIEARPYLVKEEKIFLTAMEMEDPKEVVQAIKQILKACTFGFEVESLPILDVEYLLLKLKMYSSGEVVPVHVRCNNITEVSEIDPNTGEETGEKIDKKCGHITNLEVDLEKELVIDTSKMLDNKISLTDDVGISIQPPRFEVFSGITKDAKISELPFEALAGCIECVYVGDEIVRDFTANEAMEFLGNLNQKQIRKINAYLDSIPTLSIKKNFECKSCGYKQELVLRNLFDFFTG